LPILGKYLKLIKEISMNSFSLSLSREREKDYIISSRTLSMSSIAETKESVNKADTAAEKNLLLWVSSISVPNQSQMVKMITFVFNDVSY